MFFLLFLLDDRRIPDPYLWLMDPDPGGRPKRYGSFRIRNNGWRYRAKQGSVSIARFCGCPSFLWQVALWNTVPIWLWYTHCYAFLGCLRMIYFLSYAFVFVIFLKVQYLPVFRHWFWSAGSGSALGMWIRIGLEAFFTLILIPQHTFKLPRYKDINLIKVKENVASV